MFIRTSAFEFHSIFYELRVNPPSIRTTMMTTIIATKHTLEWAICSMFKALLKINIADAWPKNRKVHASLGQQVEGISKLGLSSQSAEQDIFRDRNSRPRLTMSIPPSSFPSHSCTFRIGDEQLVELLVPPTRRLEPDALLVQVAEEDAILRQEREGGI
ncbi:hypothetical protein AYL99_11778 [Fonsecaea erecta]|uniref:Uncharacterized protein n=1 Tax=Fonsecaea erecta TaxID=1367422 RepID=A0A178Z2I1_9EURO|nr:hypothetical protein AYL99_11778 [Fonsecaea erecta]OAP54018.1 hypothetical protein AYL99_11778 [Fonsecaea erecta]